MTVQESMVFVIGGVVDSQDDLEAHLRVACMKFSASTMKKISDKFPGITVEYAKAIFMYVLPPLNCCYHISACKSSSVLIL